jgi:hypothetical protein
MGLGVSSIIGIVMYGQEGLRKGLSESTRVGVITENGGVSDAWREFKWRRSSM